MLRKFCFVAVSLLFSTQVLAAMYATTGGGGSGPYSLYTIDMNTGAATLVGTPNFGGAVAVIHLGLPGLDFSSDGRLFAVTGSDDSAQFPTSLVQLNRVTGALIQYIGALTGDHNDIRDIAIQPGSNTIFGTSYNGYLYTINSTSAVVTEIGGSILYGPLAFARDGTLYMAQMDPNEARALYTVNTSTGNATFVADLGHYYMGLGMGPDGMLYGADFAGNQQWGNAGGTSGDIYRINPATGQETFLGSNPNHVIHDIAFSEVSLPVPSLTGWGVAILVLCLAWFGCRRLLG